MSFRIAAALLAVSAFGLNGGYALAQEDVTQAPGPLAFQLNNAQTVEGSCQLTFVVQNDTGSAIEKSSYNMAIVNAEGLVTMLITFEFRPLPAGRPKVQQFGLAGQPCEDISAISINEFVECTTAGGVASTLCEEAITQSSRTAIEFPWEL